MAYRSNMYYRRELQIGESRLVTDRPRRTRAESHKRGDQALAMCEAGATYPEIAKALGYNTSVSAYSAIKAARKRS